MTWQRAHENEDIATFSDGQLMVMEGWQFLSRAERRQRKLWHKPGVLRAESTMARWELNRRRLQRSVSLP